MLKKSILGLIILSSFNFCNGMFQAEPGQRNIKQELFEATRQGRMLQHMHCSEIIAFRKIENPTEDVKQALKNTSQERAAVMARVKQLITEARQILPIDEIQEIINAACNKAAEDLATPITELL